MKTNCSESLRYIHEILNDNEPVGCDGLMTVKDVEWGKHLINFDADHFELIGMRSDYNANALFEFYSNHVKSNEPEFMKSLKI